MSQDEPATLNPSLIVAINDYFLFNSPCKEEMMSNDIEKIISEEIIRPSWEEIFKNIENKPDFNNDINLLSVKKPTLMTQGIQDYGYNQTIQTLVKKLSEDIPVYRGIRGDGNCFYRSFGLSFLEKLYVEEKYRNRLARILVTLQKNKSFLDICRNKYTMNEAIILQKSYIQFLILLYKYSKEQKPEAVIIKICALMNNSKDFDSGTVLLIRAFCLRILDKNSDESEMKEELNIDLTEYKTLMEKEVSNLQVWGQEAEQFSALLISKSLNVKLLIHYLEKNQVNKNDPKVLKDEHLPIKEEDDLNIDLYFRPGHYDVGYSREHAKKYYKDLVTEALPIEIEYKNTSMPLVSRKQEILMPEPKKEFCCSCYKNFDEEDVLFFPCKHKECMICLLEKYDIREKKNVECLVFKCKSEVPFVDYQKTFEVYKAKKICNRCYIFSEKIIELLCGHIFCSNCMTVINISNKCAVIKCGAKTGNPIERDKRTTISNKVEVTVSSLRVYCAKCHTLKLETNLPENILEKCNLFYCNDCKFNYKYDECIKCTTVLQLHDNYNSNLATDMITESSGTYNFLNKGHNNDGFLTREFEKPQAFNCRICESNERLKKLYVCSKKSCLICDDCYYKMENLSSKLRLICKNCEFEIQNHKNRRLVNKEKIVQELCDYCENFKKKLKTKIFDFGNDACQICYIEIGKCIKCFCQNTEKDTFLYTNCGKQLCRMCFMKAAIIMLQKSINCYNLYYCCANTEKCISDLINSSPIKLPLVDAEKKNWFLISKNCRGICNISTLHLSEYGREASGFNLCLECDENKYFTYIEKINYFSSNDYFCGKCQKQLQKTKVSTEPALKCENYCMGPFWYCLKCRRKQFAQQPDNILHFCDCK